MSHHSPVGSQHHIVPIRIYFITWIVLLILMTATTEIALHLSLGTLGNNIVAMAIAATKAVLVLAIFMGVLYTNKLARMFAFAGFCWLTIIFGILIDYRAKQPIPGFMHDQSSGMNLSGQTMADFAPPKANPPETQAKGSTDVPVPVSP